MVETMDLRIVSDLHLEFMTFADIPLLGKTISAQPADILVLAGDVCPIKSKRWIALLDATGDAFKHILWVPGNHEYYGSDLILSGRVHYNRVSRWNAAVGYEKLIYLNQKTIEIDNVKFIGCTLWTDFDRENPIAMLTSNKIMNDYNRIKMHRRKLKPVETTYIHRDQKNWLFKESKAKGTNVVISHHAPTFQSIHPHWRTSKDHLLNCAYASDLSNEILSANIALWVHGHMHDSVEYQVGDTLVYANPKGNDYPSRNEKFDGNATKRLERGCVVT